MALFLIYVFPLFIGNFDAHITKTEEIQIEPDIIDSSDEYEDQIKTKGSHTLPIVAAPTKPQISVKPTTIQIRPLHQMKPDIPEPPAQTYICSFCNGKQSSQDNLFQHLTQHVNFGGVSPSKLDLEKGIVDEI